ncbi:hypothetical protein KAR48_13265 [bacterium]|nr:hypothetical protein [bacterium]
MHGLAVRHILLLLVVLCPLLARAEHGKVDSSSHSEKGGRFAVLYQMSDDLSFSTENGGVLFVKFHFTNNYAVRLGYSYYKSKGKTEWLSGKYRYNELIVNKRNKTVLFQVVRFFNSQYGRFIVGGGYVYQKTYVSDEFWSLPGDPLPDEYQGNYVKSSDGLNLFAGIEVFLNSKISVALECHYNYYDIELFQGGGWYDASRGKYITRETKPKVLVQLYF